MNKIKNNMCDVARIAASTYAFAVLALAAAGAANADIIPASAYIQDGLVVQYDGIENAGPGVHADNLTAWKDLTGNGHDLTLDAGDTIYSDRVNIAKATRTASNDVFAAYSPITIEFNARPTAMEAAGSWSAPIASIPYIGSFGWDARNGAIAVMRPQSEAATANNYRTYNSGYTTLANLISAGVYKTYSVCPGYGKNGSANDPVYVNGSITSKNGSMDWDGGTRSSSLQLTVGHAKTASDVRSIRIYSRALTAEEIAVNVAVDKIRFDGADLNVLPDGWHYDETSGTVVQNDPQATLTISGMPEDIGSPSPAYGETTGLTAGASFLVSCGATSVTNAAGSVQYSCTGWKLFDDEGTLKSSGTDTSFTYTHPNPAEYRRLEWQWAESPITDAITRLDETAYAQDGLVVNFDALRNAGANVPRDPSATKWVDIVSGRTATLKSLADDSILGCWTKNAYRFMGQSYFEFDEAYQIGDHYTVQVACDVWAPNSTTYNKNSFGVFGRSGGMYMNRLGTENTWDSYYFGQYGGAAIHRIQFINWDGKHLTMIRDGGNKAGTSLTTAYPAVTARGSHNGATVSGNAPAKQWMIGGWNPDAANLMNGSFHAVRIYSKAISQDEMARNMLVDRARFFGIAEAKNMVVVASGLPGAEGTEADGAYLVAGSHTFTAPQSVTVGGNTYACTGYSLETFGSNTGYYTVWGGATESPDRSYTFTETWDGTPSVRLTWQWRLIDGLERYDASLYPQHGLVANFDGIRNAGATNAHDASAIVWRDVSGNGLHATNFVVDAALERGSWADGNGYRFVTNDQFRTSALLELGPQFTWQIATTLAADVSNAKYYRPFSSGDGKTYFRGRPHIEQSYFYCRSQAVGGWNWEGKYVNAFRDNTASGWTMGTATPTFQTFSFDQKTTGVNRWIIGGNGTTAEAFKGTVHSVRVYDRMLTAAELKNTREIDDIRFRGSVPATNTVFVATSLEGAEGDQECGIYRVAGAGHAFTATERRRIGGSGYAATRCIVETWNATSKMWENPVSSMGSTWTTPAVDSWPSRRITWHWSIPGMMIFVR